MKEKMVRVVATGRGHDGVQVREAGDEFDMPESSLTAEAPLLDEKGKKVFDGNGKPEMVSKAPSWFERKDKKEALTSADDLA